MHYLRIIPGALLATLLLPTGPLAAFTLTLNPNLCQNPSDCAKDYQGSTAQLDFKFTDTPAGVGIEVAIANNTPRQLGSALVGIALDFPDFVRSFSYDQGQSVYGQLYRDAALLPLPGTFDVGVRSRNLNPANNPGDNTFGGGNPIAGLLPGQTTTIYWTVDAGDRNAKMLEEYMARAYINQHLRGAARFEQVGFQGKGKDRVLGIVKKVPPPPKDIPEPSLVLGLGAIAAITAIRRTA